MGLPYVNGSLLLARRGHAGATGNWYNGLHEPDDMAFALHLLRPGDLFIDVGANLGSYTILAAAGVGAEVIAFEPVPETFDMLKRNVGINDVHALVTAHQLGISDCKGVLRFTAHLDAMNHVASDINEEGPIILVNVEKLDTICQGRTPKLLKIDVEGHEQSVIDGASSTLSEQSLIAVIMETNAIGERADLGSERLIASMAAHGFSPYLYDWMSRKLRPGIGTCNTIFLRNVKAAQTICTSARYYSTCNGEI